MTSLLTSLHEILGNCEQTRIRIVLAHIKNVLDRNIPSVDNVINALVILNEIFDVLKKNFVIQCKYESLNTSMVKAIHMCSIKESIHEFFKPKLHTNESIELFKSVMVKLNGMIGTEISLNFMRNVYNENYHKDNLDHAYILRNRGYPISYFDETSLIDKIDLEENDILKSDEELCPICLDNFEEISNFAILDSCNHYHCAKCIEEIFTRSGCER